ncbi:sigma-70 family RNA polymerase sigma factor [Chengkuizengella sediminis]|nr:sigma-70 family RNA polymerase sigma factor [Chengkuizengella sediminis]NDI34952.1 sigma-70 family RNA polymerase sigma factor [Chengkuizengella sediminis]
MIYNSTKEKVEKVTTEQQFKQIFKANYSLVVNKINQILSDRAIAEDLAQDVFMQLYNTNWNEIENIPAWLRKSAAYASYNHIRSEKRESERIKKESTSIQETIASSEDQFLHKDEVSNVQAILETMDDRERNLLLMKYSGFSYKEVAHTLGITQTSIGKLLSRARNKFSDLYEQKRGGE